MRHSLVEPERTPDSPIALVETRSNRKGAATRFPYLRLYLYIFRAAVLITLTVVLFSNGVYIISLNGKKLGFWALNFNVPLPFLLIGLWSILILTMTILSLIAVVKICALLFRVLHLPAIVQRKAA